MQKLFRTVLVLLFSLPLVVQAQDKMKYGPFTAIARDAQTVEDVLVEGDNIYVKVKPEARGASFSVKVSDKNMGDYRAWNDGSSEKVVKVYQSQQANKQGYTYRVNTAANYIEYHLDGKMVLHLERAK